MIRIDARIEGGNLGGIPVEANASEARTIVFNAMDESVDWEVAGRIEVDDELNELRIIVDGECVYSALGRGEQNEDKP